MGKFRASLLSIVFQLFLITAILADDRVRSVQKELQKRHLFHGDSTGEISPALTAAIRRYQEIKGFARTGVIDWETSASLGIADHTLATTTPSVVDNRGNFRGANGEALPGPLPARWGSDERSAQFEHTVADPNPLPAADTRGETGDTPRNKAAGKRRPAARSHAIRPRKETNPFLAAFNSIDHARKFLFGDADAKKKRRTGKGL
jgi:peptidoglycan hydrolase-like protein with peptidoglycan-binding domain